MSVPKMKTISIVFDLLTNCDWLPQDMSLEITALVAIENLCNLRFTQTSLTMPVFSIDLAHSCFDVRTMKKTLQ